MKDSAPLLSYQTWRPSRGLASGKIMGFIRRHSVVIVLGILVTVMLLATQLKALPDQQIMRADQMTFDNAKMVDLTKITMAEFKPEMVVGLYYVEDESDAMFVKLNAEKKPVTIFKIN
jgi:hypothetical protein